MVTLLSRVAVIVLNLGTGVIIARALGPAGRGAVTAISLWPSIACGLLTIGIPVALRYYVRQRADNQEQLFSIALLLSAAFGTVGIAVGVFLLPHLLGQYSARDVVLAQLMLVFTPIFSVSLVLQGYLEARGLFARSNSLLFLPTVATLVALVALQCIHGITTLSAALIYLVPGALIPCYTVFQLRQSIHRPVELARRSKLLLHFGLRAYGLDIINTLSPQVGQILVIGLLSATSFGMYAVAFNVSRVIAVVGTSLNSVLFPRASELEPEQAIHLVTRSARLVAAATALSAVAFAMLMPFVIRIAYGRAYISDVELAQILTFEMVISATVSTLSQAFMATGRPGLVTCFQTCGLITTFPLMIMFIPRYGLIGAGLALLGSTILRLFLVLASYPIFLGQRVPNLLVTAADLLDLNMKFRRAFR